MKYSKEELIEASGLVLDKMEVNKYKKIFVAGAVTAGIVGGFAAVRSFFPSSSPVLDTIFNSAIAVNYSVTGVNIFNVYKAFQLKKIGVDALNELKRGEMTEEKYFNNFLQEELDYLHTTMEKIQQEIAEKKEKGRSIS